MIIDTTYLLPLAGIDVETDLLRAIVEGKVKTPISLAELKVSLISLFELQAKAAKLEIPVERVVEAVEAIVNAFEVIPFTGSDIIRAAFRLRRRLRDYVDCIIAGTAIALGEDLVTEDTDIHSIAGELESEYGIKIYSYRSLVKTSSSKN